MLLRSLRTVGEHSFDSLAMKLRAKETVQGTQELLRRGLGVDGNGPTQTRVFLSAYMMIAQPEAVFTERGEIEIVCYAPL